MGPGVIAGKSLPALNKLAGRTPITDAAKLAIMQVLLASAAECSDNDGCERVRVDSVLMP